MKRECGECTKCCEGWLTTTVKTKNIYPGNPCKFVAIGKGCTIYSERPRDPCITYKCAWLTEEDIPEWMKPDKINAIIDYRYVNNIKYLCVNEAGEVLRSDVLTQLFLYAINNNLNFLWKVKSGINYIGSAQFLEEMKKELEKK